MRVCDGHEEGNSADEQTDTSRNTERLPAHDENRSSRPVFPVVMYLLTKQNKEQMDFSLKPSVTKLVCMRTSSKGQPPKF